MKTKVRCPKCKNAQELELIEVWEGHTISWRVNNGNLDRDDGALESGNPSKVEARCTCGHSWRVRGVLQIDDVLISN